MFTWCVPLFCMMHAFKGTTEQIRGPSLCTNGLSLISHGDGRASLPLGDQGALSSTRCSEASMFPLCVSWTMAHTKHQAHRKCFYPAIGLSGAHGCWISTQSSCLQSLLVQGPVWVWCVFWIWHHLGRRNNSFPWTEVITCLTKSRSSCCGDESCLEMLWGFLGTHS